MSRHRDTVYFRHMLEHARTALAMASEKQRAALDSEPMLRYALLHLISVIGEAANRVSPEGRSAHPGLPWQGMVTMRNKLIHGYDVVDLDILWQTLRDDLPALVGALASVIGEDVPPD